MNSNPQWSDAGNLIWLFVSFIFVISSLLSQSQSIAEFPSVFAPILSGLVQSSSQARGGLGQGARLPDLVALLVLCVPGQGRCQLGPAVTPS